MIRFLKKTLRICLFIFWVNANFDYAYSQCSCSLPLCSGNVISEPYSPPATDWTYAGNPVMMNESNGLMNFVSVTGGPTVRMYKSHSNLLGSSKNFQVDCIVSISTAGNNNPGVYVYALTEFNTDPDFSGPANDAIYLLLHSALVANCACPAPSAACPWYFTLGYRNGVNYTSTSPTINIPAIGTYYTRLVRRGDQLHLSVFSDPGYTTHIPQSPICLPICGVVENFRWLQHGKFTSGVCRESSLRLDYLKVCTYSSGCTWPSGTPCRLASDPANQFNDDQTTLPVIYPNPSTGMVSIDNIEHETSVINISDMTGRLLRTVNLTENIDLIQFNIGDLPNGIYTIETITLTKRFKSKISIQK